MSNKKFFLMSPFIVIILLLILAIPLWILSNSRTFQFYGGLIHRVNTNQKVIALTFDDGPTERTPGVLKMMKKLDTKATFYVIGSEVEKSPEIVKNILNAKHDIANHSYSHRRMLLQNPHFIEKEIEDTNKLLKKVGYTGEITFRPPFGKKLVGLPKYLKSKNIKTIMWDVEPETYEEIAKDKNKIVEHVLQNTKPGSIILLHPHGPNEEVRKAIPEIVQKLKMKGYTFVTVNELLKYEGK